jgi:hypothetical protein
VGANGRLDQPVADNVRGLVMRKLMIAVLGAAFLLGTGFVTPTTASAATKTTHSVKHKHAKKHRAKKSHKGHMHKTKSVQKRARK